MLFSWAYGLHFFEIPEIDWRFTEACEDCLKGSGSFAEVMAFIYMGRFKSII